MTINEADDNARQDAVAVELESASSPSEDPTITTTKGHIPNSNVSNGDGVDQNFFPDDELILGRWVLVNTPQKSRIVSFDSGEMTITRRVNEMTGMVEYHNTKWTKLRLFGCCPISSAETAIIRFTSNDTFTVMIYGKAMGIDNIKVSGNGSRVGNMLNIEYQHPEGRFITSTTEEFVFQGDKCRMKSVVSEPGTIHEFERVETLG